VNIGERVREKIALQERARVSRSIEKVGDTQVGWSPRAAFPRRKIFDSFLVSGMRVANFKACVLGLYVLLRIVYQNKFRKQTSVMQLGDEGYQSMALRPKSIFVTLLKLMSKMVSAKIHRSPYDRAQYRFRQQQ